MSIRFLTSNKNNSYLVLENPNGVYSLIDTQDNKMADIQLYKSGKHRLKYLPQPLVN